jgi:Tfp pilus assembly protein PilF
VESLTKAVEIFRQFGSAHYALAQALRKLGRSEEAARHLAFYERFKLFVPPSNDPLTADLAARVISVTSYLRQAADLQSQGRTQEALELHLKALETDANSAQAHANLVSLYGQLNQPEKAEQHYRKAVELSPNLADSYYNYGVLLFGQQRFSKARKAFEQAIRANRYHAEAHNNLGYLLEREGGTGGAEKHYREAIANQPGYRLAHFHLGRLLLNRRDFAGAVAQFEQTITVDDESTPGYLYALGAAHGRAGDRNRAVEFLRQARDKAAARGQSLLLSSIERDLGVLERRKPTR